jgi:hypothetical protein
MPQGSPKLLRTSRLQGSETLTLHRSPTPQGSPPLPRNSTLLGTSRLQGSQTLTLQRNPTPQGSPTLLASSTLPGIQTLLGNPTLLRSPASLRRRPLARLASETVLDRLLVRLAAVRPPPPRPAAMFACRSAAARNTPRQLLRRAGRRTPTATGEHGWVGDALPSARLRVGFPSTGRASVSCGSMLSSRTFQSEP